MSGLVCGRSQGPWGRAEREEEGVLGQQIVDLCMSVSRIDWIRACDGLVACSGLFVDDVTGVFDGDNSDTIPHPASRSALRNS